MNKTQLVSDISLRSGVSKVDAQKVVNTLIEVAADTLRQGEKISLTGLGTFCVSKTKERTGRNFRTGDPVKIAARNSVKFSPASELQSAVQ